MTKATTTDTGVAEKKEAPEGYYWASIKDREMLIKETSAGQQMVLAALIRDAKTGTLEYNLASLAKIMTLLRSLIPAEEHEWLEDGILADRIGVADFAFVFAARTGPPAPTTGPVKPRRGR